MHRSLNELLWPNENKVLSSVQINEIMVLNCRVCLEWPCVALPHMVLLFLWQWTCVALGGPWVALHGLVMALYGLLWQNIVFSRGHRSKFSWSCFS